MQVGATNDGLLLQPAAQRDQEHQLQAVFSDVLEAAGRVGYASAEDRAGGEPLETSAVNAWDNWFDSQQTRRYSQVKQPEQLKTGFSDIVARAHTEGGYEEPHAFLASLSREELSVVQAVQHLAEPIDVGSLTEEGALNLLLPPAAQIDLNHDGFTRSGAAYGMRFPDSNTPADVAAAWEEATADMPLEERMIFELQMMLPILTANIHLKPDGTYSHTSEPGDPDHRNPFAEPGFPYEQAAQDQLDHLEFSKRWLSEDRYNQGVEFWSRFQRLLEDANA